MPTQHTPAPTKVCARRYKEAMQLDILLAAARIYEKERNLSVDAADVI